MPNKKLKLKNKYVLGLAAWLNQLNLVGKQSRYRTRFVTDVSDKVSELEMKRQEMLEKYANKDDDGEPVIKEEDGQAFYDIPDGDAEEFREKYQNLLEEEFEYEIMDDREDMVKEIKNLVLNTDYKFGPAEDDDKKERQAKMRQAQDYDQWCKAFEGLDI